MNDPETIAFLDAHLPGLARNGCIACRGVQCHGAVESQLSHELRSHLRQPGRHSNPRRLRDSNQLS